MKIFLGTDHAGFELKELLKTHVASLGHAVTDCGAPVLTPGDDYPEMVGACARAVAADAGSVGIVLGASGQGEAMVANRVPGIRAAVYYGGSSHTQTDQEGEQLSLIASTRAHNDANILSLGARFIQVEEAKASVEEFLATPFSQEERHFRRISAF